MCDVFSTRGLDEWYNIWSLLLYNLEYYFFFLNSNLNSSSCLNFHHYLKSLLKLVTMLTCYLTMVWSCSWLVIVKIQTYCYCGCWNGNYIPDNENTDLFLNLLQPNCYSRLITVDGDEHIIIFAKRDIKQWEELTYDYRFSSGFSLLNVLRILNFFFFFWIGLTFNCLQVFFNWWTTTMLLWVSKM